MYTRTGRIQTTENESSLDLQTTARLLNTACLTTACLPLLLRAIALPHLHSPIHHGLRFIHQFLRLKDRKTTVDRCRRSRFSLFIFQDEKAASASEKKEKKEIEEILQGEKAFEANYFLVIVDMGTTSLRNRFEELQVFKNIFGFLLSSRTLTSLDDIELTDSCTRS
ncbi:hypothetical protein EJB05_33530, partial [Eragrostis curvula]